MKFILPMPPSINQTYGVSRTGEHAMYKRQSVRDWEELAGWEVKKQRPHNLKTLTQNVAVGIKWFYSVNRDIDAGIKVLLDLFQKQRIYENDRQVRLITHIEIAEDRFNPRVEVFIDEIV